jgi:hypothetical protein
VLGFHHKNSLNKQNFNWFNFSLLDFTRTLANLFDFFLLLHRFIFGINTNFSIVSSTARPIAISLNFIDPHLVNSTRLRYLISAEAGISVNLGHPQGRALKSTLNFLGRIPSLSLIGILL